MIYKTINLKWLGHSSFRIITGDKKVIYIDPYRIYGEDHEIEKADFIFITHSHYDHCSIEDIQKIAKDNTTIICPADISSKLRHINQKINIKLAEIGQRQDLIEEVIKFWPVPAYNINKVYHSKEEEWVGYIIQINDTLIYHAGDSDLIPEMKSIEGIDIALLPVGGTYTMNAGEAAKAVSIIKPKIAIPMHYGTVSGTGERKEADIFSKYCSTEGIQVKILEKEV